jgi:ribosomal protein S18 acetylase RimI-like enzyme
MTTEPIGAAVSTSQYQQHQQQLPQTLIRLRLATRSDVPAIQRCNLACLPENYNSQFYTSHLRQWPELALVAEAVETVPPPSPSQQSNMHSAGRGNGSDRHDRMMMPSSYDERHQEMFRPSTPSSRMNPFSGFPGHLSSSSYSSYDRHHGGYGQYGGHAAATGTGTTRGGLVGGEPKIVAYVLGKVETRPVMDYDYPMSPMSRYDLSSSRRNVETLGHVTSLAVQREYRRLGLGRALMEQLQSHMQHYRGSAGIASCGLHVRVSNDAAYRLYQHDGYEVESVLPHYYQDGEEAYFMRKRLPPPPQSPAFDNPLFGSKKIWRNGPEHFRLPRIHCVIEEEVDEREIQQNISSSGGSMTGRSNTDNSNHNNEELLTGSM